MGAFPPVWLGVEFEKADLNTVLLPENEFDILFCHASPHHVLKIEAVARQIRKTMRENGELVVAGILTRDGNLTWPEDRKLVRAI